jgi:putative phosphoesterase
MSPPTDAASDGGAGLRIGLLSDTHIPDSRPTLWPEVLEQFQGVDLILHAGDIVSARVLDELEQVAPVYAAEGNHDSHLADDPRIEPVHMLELEGHRLALLHDFEPLTWELGRLCDLWLDGIRPDIVVFGDTHYEHLELREGTLLINPGSPTYPRNMSTRLGHIAFLTLRRGHPPQGEIVDLAERYPQPG